MLQAKRNFIPDEYRGDADVNGSEGRAVELQLHDYVISGRRTVNHAELPSDAGRTQKAEVRTLRQNLSGTRRVGIENRSSFGIYNRGLINHRPTAQNRLHHRIEVAVRAQVINDGPSHRFWIASIHASTAQIRDGVGGEVCQL